MNGGNMTAVTEILLLGFKNVHKVKGLLLILLLLAYCVTVCVNLMIIILVSSCKTLHSPMYFLLSQLSLADMLLTTDIVPYALVSVLHNGSVMSFTGCVIQFYVFGGTESSECLILTIMAYDRYLAICNTLRYSSMMTSMVCLKSIFCAWLLSFSCILVTTLMLSTLEFCGPNVIDHFFCDFAPLLELSCSATSMVQIEAVLLSALVMIFPLIIIVLSYGCIIMAILRLSSNADRWKSFSTCSSHLTVVCIFYGTLIMIYVLPTKGLSVSINKVISALYTIVTPMLNPLIYSLKNKDIKHAVKYLSNIWAHKSLCK
ncbi:olfactory receptor 5V1-like [Mantella aurantiaca]